MNKNEQNQEQIKQKYLSIIDLILQWNHEYYNLDKPTVADKEYDKYYNELLLIEKEYPQLKVDYSPTNFIGGIASNKFTKVKHKNPMLSLNKAYTIEEIEKYIENISEKVDVMDLLFSLEYKIDGLSIALHYSEGKLVKALTRGDGVEGEDVTENVYQISSIPKKIDYLKDLEVRGEVFLTKQQFQINNNKYFEDLKTKEAKKPINEQKSDEELKKMLFANPRNAASGTLRQKDSRIVKDRNLSAYLYEISDALEHNINTIKESFGFLKRHNFPTQNYNFYAENIDEIAEEIDKFSVVKNNLDYDVDGFVIKFNFIKYFDKLGYTSKFPHYAIAFKLEGEEAITKIKDIETFVGRTGKITYVANVEKVLLNQTNVQKATLHNYEFIQKLNLNIGDQVKIIKAGEIIPKVIDLAQKNSVGVFEKVLKCPSCESTLVYVEQNVDQFCLNDMCPEKIKRSLIHFCSKKALNIKTLGNKTIDIFFDKKIVNNIQDIFNLENKYQQLIQLDKFQDKKVQNILNSIEKSLKVELYRVLYGLGIKDVGLRASKLICQKITEIKDLLEIDLDELIHIKDIGEKTILSLKKYIQNDKNKELILFLNNIFVQEDTQKQKLSNKLENMNICITGKLSMSRDEYFDFLNSHGAKTSTDVTKDVTHLLVGDKQQTSSSSKYKKAIKNNVVIIDENDLKNLLK
ncbi:NAD-dependent DNA ligase LigA [Mycoplasmopsis ciconiae]|uniref:DNA ligase n=1 Tax=Mycoplasmopsis ciconiae TaxID=561067 RepID=A0ABU7MKL6_9BACT|nr:NAD-dependent DNA ligase LigA [Mycoplasmopsis ciconiae]